MASVEELIQKALTELSAMKAIVQRVEVHAEKTNGRLLEVEKTQLRQEGALGIMRWLGGFLIASLSAAAAIAGVVIAALLLL